MGNIQSLDERGRRIYEEVRALVKEAMVRNSITEEDLRARLKWSVEFTRDFLEGGASPAFDLYVLANLEQALGMRWKLYIEEA